MGKADWTTAHIQKDEYYSANQIATLTNVTNQSIRYWAKKRWLYPYMVDGYKQPRFLGEDVIHVINKRLALSSPERARERNTKATRAHRKRYPLRELARKATLLAIKKGILIPGLCEVCGEQKTESHHDDYWKILDVRWFCQQHHLDFHHHSLAIEIVTSI